MRQRAEMSLAIAAYFERLHEWNHDPSHRNYDALRAAIAGLRAAAAPARSWGDADVVECAAEECKK